ncbi:hypothetical protein [Desertibacillus haloalkaliphilus]|uniref:hypothetical protein n=1 Tax=Desertibacillus haloalkaliphilus TaxID=1328930 RepID=UPI001C25C3A1|nr:hypothetical protein [Desertibacillus haloalkaliphilus]MBU8908167.1 hypothetical protein [Desertibacillus haloalkaliphilus]
MILSIEKIEELVNGLKQNDIAVSEVMMEYSHREDQNSFALLKPRGPKGISSRDDYYENVFNEMDYANNYWFHLLTNLVRTDLSLKVNTLATGEIDHSRISARINIGIDKRKKEEWYGFIYNEFSRLLVLSKFANQVTFVGHRGTLCNVYLDLEINGYEIPKLVNETEKVNQQLLDQWTGVLNHVKHWADKEQYYTYEIPIICEKMRFDIANQMLQVKSSKNDLLPEEKLLNRETKELVNR